MVLKSSEPIILWTFMVKFLISAQNNEKGQILVVSQTCFVQDLLCMYKMNRPKFIILLQIQKEKDKGVASFRNKK